MSTIIRGGEIVAADRTYRADIRIEGGVIAEIGEGLSGDEEIDASEAYVIPGGIDPHVHLEMPFMGTHTADDFHSGTLAAAAGGTTTVIDFCIPAPDGSMLEAWDQWEAKSKDKAVVDYAWHMCVTGWSERTFDEMAEVVRRGVNTFKHFMAYKGALMVEDDEMFASFRRCAELGAMPLVHAENGDVVAALQQKLLDEGSVGPEAHAHSRPPEVEGEAVNRAVMIADAAGCPLYVVHVSCEQAHEAIRRARAKGMRVHGEPLIQHLVLDDGEYAHPDWDHAARRVMSPPFRDRAHQDSLWAGLQSGSLQVVATDHCAFTTEQKRAGRGDFTRIPNGTAGLEDRLSVLWTRGVETGRLTREEFVAVTSTNIARILGLYPRKGAIAVGADADIAVWDPRAGKTISARTQTSAIDYNVFEGVEVSATARHVLSRGEIVFSQGRNAEPAAGRGRFLRRAPSQPVSAALSRWKALTAPRRVVRDLAHMPAGV